MHEASNSKYSQSEPLNDAETFGERPNDSASFRNIPQVSESVGILPNGSEPFRTMPHSAGGRSENHTLTVREAVRLFEAANVARSERSLVNWCQPNRQGIARLDAYFDPNERRYFITPVSVEAVIAEEKAKAARPGPERSQSAAADEVPHDSENVRAFPKASGKVGGNLDGEAELAELRKENLDLKITNRGKDFYIDQLKAERDSILLKALESSRRVGELENRLQIGGPASGGDSIEGIV